MMATLAVLAISACDKENAQEQSQHDPASDEDQVEVVAYDGLEWLQNSIVIVDEKGEVVRRIYGKALDPSTPDVISVPVKDIEMAENIFLSWVAPGKEATKVDGGYDYTLTSEGGVAQGGVTFRAAGGGGIAGGGGSEGGVIARMDVNGGTDMKQVSQVNFISSDLWPDNDATEKYEAGKLYVFNTYYIVRDYDAEGWPFVPKKGDVTFYCIIGNDNGQEAVLVHLSPDKNNITYHATSDEYLKNDVYKYLATVPEAEKVLKYYNENNKEWEAMIDYMESIGHTWDWHFGISTTGNEEFMLNSVDLEEWIIKCLDLDRHPGKIGEVKYTLFAYRYLLVRTFPPYIED